MLGIEGLFWCIMDGTITVNNNAHDCENRPVTLNCEHPMILTSDETVEVSGLNSSL